MARQGRDLELLVQTIEKALAGTAIRVISPHHVADKDTGQLREIDVALIATVGSTSVLVIVECRDRDGSEGVEWIEQLASKRDSVRASKAVAVSSQQFTAGAIEKAKAHDIDLRLLHEVTSSDVLNWLATLTVEVTHQRGNPCGDLILYFEDLPELRDEMRLLMKRPAEQHGLINAHTRTPIALMQVLSLISRDHPTWKSVPDDGTRVRRRIQATFGVPSEGYCIRVKGRDIHLVGVDFECECWTETVSTPFVKALQYTSPMTGPVSGSLATAARTSISVQGIPVDLTLVADGEMKARAVSLRFTKPRPNDKCPCGSGMKYKKCCGMPDRSDRQNASQ